MNNNNNKIQYPYKVTIIKTHTHTEIITFWEMKSYQKKCSPKAETKTKHTRYVSTVDPVVCSPDIQNWSILSLSCWNAGVLSPLGISFSQRKLPQPWSNPFLKVHLHLCCDCSGSVVYWTCGTYWPGRVNVNIFRNFTSKLLNITITKTSIVRTQN